MIYKTSPLLLLLSPDSYLWFLWDLFFISLIVNCILALVGKNENCTFSILPLVSLVLLCLGKFIQGNDFNIKTICWMFQFYVAGAALKVYGERFVAQKMTGIVIAILFMLLVWVRYEYMSDEGLITYVIMMLIAYMGCLACFLLFRSYAEKNTPLTLLGQSTLGIYAVHQGLIKICGIDNVWLSFIVVLFLSVAFVYVIRKTQYLKFIIGE